MPFCNNSLHPDISPSPGTNRPCYGSCLQASVLYPLPVDTFLMLPPHFLHEIAQRPADPGPLPVKYFHSPLFIHFSYSVFITFNKMHTYYIHSIYLYV